MQDRMLNALIAMTHALTHDANGNRNWESDQVAFFLACEHGGFGDLAADLWADAKHGA